MTLEQKQEEEKTVGIGITLNSLYLCVKDMERAIDFYERFLERPVTEKDEIFSIFDVDGFRFCLFDNNKARESVTWGDNCLPSFRIDTLESLLKKIEELQVEIVFPLTHIKDNWVLEFKDSEGNDIEVYCRKQSVVRKRQEAGKVGQDDIAL